jgi:hypothetical protein
VIGLALQVGGCRWLRSEDAVVDGQPNIYPLLRAATWRLRLPEPEMRFENAWLAQGPKVRRLFAGGNQIRTIGPASGKVVDAKFQRSNPGRPNTDFWEEGADFSLEGRDIELSVSPKDIRTSPYDLCANRSDRRQSREGDRWFESISLQRRVRCEPEFRGRTLEAGRKLFGNCIWWRGGSRRCSPNIR